MKSKQFLNLDDIFILRTIVPREGGFDALVALNSAHPVFKSHFPGTPIVPGVCLMRQVELLASRYISMPLRLAGVSNAKFINIVSAAHDGVGDVQFSVNFDRDQPLGTLKVKATVSSPAGDMVYARFSMSFNADSSTDTDLQ